MVVSTATAPSKTILITTPIMKPTDATTKATVDDNHKNHNDDISVSRLDCTNINTNSNNDHDTIIISYDSDHSSNDNNRDDDKHNNNIKND